MTIKPEDVRKHLEAKQGGAGGSAASALETRAPSAAAVEAAKRNEILDNISASYFLLRRGLAMLAFALPILLWLWTGPDHLQGSISAYYHYSATGDLRYGAGTSRDILVGILWAAGAFLFFYKGYSWQENLALDVAGVAAVTLALFPMDWPPNPALQPSFVSIVHSASAVLLFLPMAYVCLCQSGPTLRLMKDPARQRLFKRIYAVLGTLMIVVPLTVVALHYLVPGPADKSPVVFAIEVAGIYVFSAFWLVKSREIAILERQ
jgi:hypothetical protein